MSRIMSCSQSHGKTLDLLLEQNILWFSYMRASSLLNRIFVNLQEFRDFLMFVKSWGLRYFAISGGP
jgi:hypothetical protein